MKVRACFCLAMVLAVCFAASVAHATLQDDVDQAVSIIERFEEIPESAIPPRVLRDAKGLAILAVTKAGFIVSGRGGAGVVVARTDTGWSGPPAIRTRWPSATAVDDASTPPRRCAPTISSP